MLQRCTSPLPKITPSCKLAPSSKWNETHYPRHNPLTTTTHNHFPLPALPSADSRLPTDDRRAALRLTQTAIMNLLVHLVTGDFPLSNEILCLAMAISGSMTVRNGANRNGDLHWFHAFLRSTLAGYAGATFTNIFMGKPTAMFSNDVFFGSCLVGFAIVNWLPLGLGRRFCGSFLGVLLTAVGSQVFRVGGVAGFSDAAQNAFKGAPSKYYPTPVFGPILFPTLLG